MEKNFLEVNKPETILHNPPLEVAKNVWNLTPPPSTYHIVAYSHLIVGTEKALLFDTNYGWWDLPALIKEITPNPVLVFNSHFHGDHAGGNWQFDAIHMGPGDIAFYIADEERIGRRASAVIPVYDGDKFDLGDRVIEVVSLPYGHTPGSIALLDRKNRILFPGDPVSDQTIYILDNETSMPQFLDGINKMLSLREHYDTVICNHGTEIMDVTQLEKERDAAIAYLDGKLKGVNSWRKGRYGDVEITTFVTKDGFSFVIPSPETRMFL